MGQWKSKSKFSLNFYWDWTLILKSLGADGKCYTVRLEGGTFTQIVLVYHMKEP